MAMYGIGKIPLIELLQKPNVTQKWYADDGSAACDLKSLRAILDNLDVHGKAFSYNVEPSNCQLIVKENCRESTIKLFEGNASAETLSQLESLKGSGNTIPTDANEFNSKFVDPSSSDTDDEILDNFNLSCANDKEIEHAILSAAKSGNKQVVENILDKNPNYVTAIDEDFYTPLHRASYNGHTEVMRVLLKHGADPNAPTLDGWTPLHSACCWGKVEAASILLKAGSRVNARSYSNTTPLHTAANRPDNRAVIELLLSTPGVDPLISNESGDRPYQLAARIAPYGFLFEPFESSLSWSPSEWMQTSSSDTAEASESRALEAK
ncbi:ankyrin repeat domain-containing protein 49-like [Symsagittifera roscoffensis]|uniref:ankyrin repeat domain-containing protein 49-like n=1 Tax=Symsagittifera roscoffensis TaxID=84072 RepID=UPI00307C80A4